MTIFNDEAELVIEFYNPLTGLPDPHHELANELKQLIRIDNARFSRKHPKLTPVRDLYRLAVENLSRKEQTE